MWIGSDHYVHSMVVWPELGRSFSDSFVCGSLALVQSSCFADCFTVLRFRVCRSLSEFDSFVCG